MKNTETKKMLLNTTIELLHSSGTPEEITARQIAAKAEVNLALINYYYGSKEALINQAIDHILQIAAADWKNTDDDTLPPKERIKQMLINLSDIVFKYSNFTKHSIRYEIQENEITLPYYILPFIKSYYGNKKSEFELKLIAFQLIATLQLIFLKSDEFFRYSGENISDKKNRDEIIKMQIDLILNGGNDEH
ncbi:MAG: TetR/AcrR family transcriptional regulator [Bacillota bacterium]